MKKESKNNFDMLYLSPILMGVGIWLYFSFSFEPSKWITLFVIETLILSACIFRRYPFVLRIILAISIFVFGFANIQLRTIYLEKQLPKPIEDQVYLRGQILSYDVNYNGKPRIVLSNMENLRGDKIYGNYRLTLVHSKRPQITGDCVELVAEVAPLMKANSVGGYQPDRHLFFEKLNGSGYVLSQIYSVDCPSNAVFWQSKIDKLRQRITNRIEEIMPKDQASIAAVILAGNRTLMSHELSDNYRNSGLAHFLSISGLHMSMIAALMFFFVRLIMSLVPRLSLRYNSKKFAAICAIVVSSVYLVISGVAVPTQRAYIMILIVLLAVIFERKAISMRNLALAALIILIISPQMLISISFQLSFAAVIAMIAFYESCSTMLHRFLSSKNSGILQRFIRVIIAYLVGVIIADFIASAATLPFVIYHFNKIAVYTSLTNLLAGPIIAFIIMPAILISLLFMPFGFVFPLKIAGFGIELINNITAWVALMKGATLWVPSFPVWGMFIIIFGGLFLCLQNGRIRHLGWLFIFAGALSLFFVKLPDVMVADNGKTVAIKNEKGNLVLLAGGNRWMKQNWADKYGAVYSDEVAKEVDLPNISFDNDIGASVYGNKVVTIREYIGNRPWNK